MTAPLTFRFAQEEDVPQILRFIHALADYEAMRDQVHATEDRLRRGLFQEGRGQVLFAVEAGREIGFALFFYNFSAYLGQPVLFLENLCVLPEHRGKGAGEALLRQLAALAVQHGCGRMDWTCLDWNQPSIDFYRAHGARPLPGLTLFRADGEALHKLAEEAH